MRLALRRLVQTFALLVLVFLATRALVRALPGDPIETLIAETGTAIPRELLARELGLDRPFLPAALEDARRFLSGDLGTSLLSRRPVAELIWNAFAHTLVLVTLSLFIGLVLSATLGLLASLGYGTEQRGVSRAADRACTVFGSMMQALPTPWLGPVIAYLLGVALPLLPVGGHPALPALTLGLVFAGFWSRLIRDRTQQMLLQGAAPGARSRGLAELWVSLKYGLAPCLGSLGATLGTQIGSWLGGAVIAEVIFDWPGLGQLLVQAVLSRDYPVIEWAIFLGASTALLGTWVGDLFQERWDPRPREAPLS